MPQYCSGVVQMRSDRQHHVRFGPEFVAERQVGRQRVAVVEDAAAAPVGDDRRLQEMREPRHLGAGVERAAAGDDERAFGRAETLGGGGDGVVVDRRLGDRQRRLRRDRPRLPPHVDRAFERGRAGTAGEHRAYRLGDQPRRLVRRGDARRPVDQPRDDAGLVANFVQMRQAAADVALRDLTDQREDGRVHAVGGQERGGGVEQAGAGNHAIGLRLSRRQRGAERHIGGALLVTGVDGADPVGGPWRAHRRSRRYGRREARRWCRGHGPAAPRAAASPVVMRGACAALLRALLRGFALAMPLPIRCCAAGHLPPGASGSVAAACGDRSSPATGKPLRFRQARPRLRRGLRLDKGLSACAFRVPNRPLTEEESTR